MSFSTPPRFPLAVVLDDPDSRGRRGLFVAGVFIDDSHASGGPDRMNRADDYLDELAAKINARSWEAALGSRAATIHVLLDVLNASGGSIGDSARTIAAQAGIDLDAPPEVELKVGAYLRPRTLLIGGLPAPLCRVKRVAGPLGRVRGRVIEIELEMVEGAEPETERIEFLPFEPEQRLIHVLVEGRALCTTGPTHNPGPGSAWVRVEQWREATCAICRYHGATHQEAASGPELTTMLQEATRQLERRSPPPIRVRRHETQSGVSLCDCDSCSAGSTAAWRTWCACGWRVDGSAAFRTEQEAIAALHAHRLAASGISADEGGRGG